MRGNHLKRFFIEKKAATVYIKNNSNSVLPIKSSSQNFKKKKSAKERKGRTSMYKLNR
jgi:hypothetical protein